MRLIGYQVILSTEPKDLKVQVLAWAASGWKCQGGVTICKGASGILYGQAMILEEE